MILITGASKGIGQFLFNKFLEINVPVGGTYNKTEPSNFIDKGLYKVDISNYNEINIWIAKIKHKLNNIVLINCAGITYNAFAHKADIEKWNNVIDINIKGTFSVIHSLIPIMRDQHFGRIINFSSVVTSLPTVGISAYMATKSAINGITKVLAKENASMGITINSINLGYSNIGMGINDVPIKNQKILLETIPAGRFCEPEEIFLTVQFLINNEYVNGSIIDINGGLI